LLRRVGPERDGERGFGAEVDAPEARKHSQNPGNSLGALAYFLLTGQPPFPGRSAVQVLAAHLHERPAPLTHHRADLPDDLQAVVLRCLAKNPADRFPDVQSLELALASPSCSV
jgi:serine/threonine protein kinase